MSKLLDVDVDEKKTIKEWLKLYEIPFEENQTDEELKELLLSDFTLPKKLTIERYLTEKTAEEKRNEAVELLNGLECMIVKWINDKDEIIESFLKNKLTLEKLEKHYEEDFSFKSDFRKFIRCLRNDFNELYSLSEVSPTIKRIKLGKNPKAKKLEQLKAEEYAKDIWGKDPTITQENMAYQLKDKLDLNQSIRTIINWIKPFQPKP